MIEDVVRGSDGLIRAANIRTKSGRTNHLIAQLYPLEVCSTETLKLTPTIPQPSNSPPEKIDSVRCSTDQEFSLEGLSETA